MRVIKNVPVQHLMHRRCFLLLTAWRFPFLSTQRVGHVEEHSTLTTDMLSVRPRAVNTGCSLHGGGVCATGQLGLPLEPDISVFAPDRPPAVPDQPEVSMVRVRAVADQLDGVVQRDVVLVVAATEDSTAVELPPAGVRRDGQRALSGQVGHGSQLIIGRESVVARDGDDRSSPLYIVFTPPGQPGDPGEVRVVSVGGQTKQLDVVVAQLGDGAAATSGTSAVERIGGAG